MGPSGAGKTTLMEVLANRTPIEGGDTGLDVEDGMSLSNSVGLLSGNNTNPSAMSVRGHLEVSGHSVSNIGELYKQMVGFVPQEDCLWESLTVKEHLTIGAELRLNKTVRRDAHDGASGVAGLVDDVIAMLGLEDVAGSLIGSANFSSADRGISGGERKRLSVAGEIISSPSCLFLDEPTSGLSAADGFVVIRALRNLVHTREVDVVLCTVHQPRSDIFGLFTHLLVLSAGETVYNGETSGAMPFFEKVSGKVCPPGANAADFFIDLVSTEHTSSLSSLGMSTASTSMSKEQLRLAIVSCREACQQQGSASPKKSGSLPPAAEMSEVATSWSAAWWGMVKDFRIILRRDVIDYRRAWKGICTSVGNLALLVVFLGLVWSQSPKGDDVTSQFQLQNLIYISLGITSNHVTIELPLILREKEMFRKEYNAGYYSVVPFLLARILVSGIVRGVQFFFFCVVTYYWVGLDPSFGRFLLYWFIFVLDAETTAGMVRLAMVTMPTFEAGIALYQVSVMLQVIYAGFYVSYRNIADPLKIFYYVNPKRFAFAALLLNQFEEDSDVLEYNGLPSYEGETVFLDVGVLLLAAVFFNSLAAVMLCRLKPQKTKSNQVVYVEKTAGLKDGGNNNDGDGDGLGRSHDGAAHTVLNVNASENSPSGSETLTDALLPFPAKPVGATVKAVSSPQLFLRKVVPVHLSFEQLSVVKPADEGAMPVVQSHNSAMGGPPVSGPGSEATFKVLLQGISGIVEPGSIQAVMGPSGSGKTTLLSAISSNKSSDCVRWNGKHLDDIRNSYVLHRNLLGVVTQDINMMESATVRETLMFAAKLKVLGQPCTKDVEAHVDAFLDVLLLRDVANSLVGGAKNSFGKILSGGQVSARKGGSHHHRRHLHHHHYLYHHHHDPIFTTTTTATTFPIITTTTFLTITTTIFTTTTTTTTFATTITTFTTITTTIFTPSPASSPPLPLSPPRPSSSSLPLPPPPPPPSSSPPLLPPPPPPLPPSSLAAEAVDRGYYHLATLCSAIGRTDDGSFRGRRTAGCERPALHGKSRALDCLHDPPAPAGNIQPL
jgi:ABC-type multidrug transport system ATPase subunit